MGLPDIEPSETVKVGGEDVPVSGITFKGIIMLFKRFPDLVGLLGGGEVNNERLMDMGDSMVSAIIAAGIGHPGDKKQEALASRLPLEMQLDLLGAVIRVTMPNGVGPFVEKLGAVTGTLGVEPPVSTSKPEIKFPHGAAVTRVKASARQLNA